MSEPSDVRVPNHHAHYRDFAGPMGWIAAATMVFGRTADARLVAQLCDLKRGDAVVDIGCGPGVAARYAASLGAAVTGVDPAPVMLRAARLLTRREAVRYVEGAAESLPLPDRSATVVWTLASVHHWKALDSALEEVRRVLQPGGRFAAVERRTVAGARGFASHGWTGAQAETFARLCAERGFDTPVVEQHRSGRRRSVLSVVCRAR